MLHETSIATSSLSCIHQSRRLSCSQVTQLAHIIKARAFSTLRMPRAKIFTRRPRSALNRHQNPLRSQDRISCQPRFNPLIILKSCRLQAKVAVSLKPTHRRSKSLVKMPLRPWHERPSNRRCRTSCSSTSRRLSSPRKTMPRLTKAIINSSNDCALFLRKTRRTHSWLRTQPLSSSSSGRTVSCTYRMMSSCRQ